MFKQIKNAVYGPNGKMEMKELVLVNLLIMMWFMLISSPVCDYDWSDAWVLAVPLSLIGTVGGTIYQRVKIKDNE